MSATYEAETAYPYGGLRVCPTYLLVFVGLGCSCCQITCL